MCDCITIVNEQLRPANGRLTVGLGITADMGVVARLLLGVEKADKNNRKAPPNVSATFCPFCGSKLGADVLKPAERPAPVTDTKG